MRWLPLLLVACQVTPDDAGVIAPTARATVQRVRATTSPTDGATWVGMTVLVTDAAGDVVPCGEGTLTVDVAVSTVGEAGPWTPVDGASVTRVCTDEPTGDVALVVDNSGSEDGFLDPLREGATDLVDDVLAAGGRASLARVSTNVDVLAPLTDDGAALDAALAELHIANGWTALWDGVRVGNESLGGVGEVAPDLESFCASPGRLGVVVFTDGQDNNSADEQDYDHDAYPGDGLDTRLEDLYGLRSGGASTPIYTIGLGDDVDAAALSALADQTGARYLHVGDAAGVPDAWALVRDYVGANEQVCMELPEAVCGDLWISVTTTWTDGDETVTQSSVQRTSVGCPVDATGRTAVMLLTMSTPTLPTDLGASLATQAVTWTSPVAEPRVLVVRDENHHDEFDGDPDVIAGWLFDAGLEVVRLDEEDGGISVDDLTGFDVVWYSNPGYPPDDESSIQALMAFRADGGGVVLQGDDMAWSWGDGFSMTDLSHVDFIDNGTNFCGERTDNLEGVYYEVTLGDGHPILAGHEGQSFLYGDDIDTSVAVTPDEVLATATLAGADDCDTVPVILAYGP
jgi:hypothetical protein